MINFESDYTEGCIPAILEALEKTNSEQTSGYGEDPHCENARDLIRKACHAPQAEVQFLVGGTQANMTVIAHTLKPYQGVICADSGHINCHETGAVEASGHKCIAIPSSDGKITAAEVEEIILFQKNNESFEHIVQPGMVYLSWPTETGTLYTKKELTALYQLCQKYGLKLFVDGARMGYGLASKNSDLKLSDFAKLTDVFYIGGTKVGALFGEAVVILNDDIKENFRYSIKERGGMLAKGRLLGIQFETLFANNCYLKISKNAAVLAEQLALALKQKGYQFQFKPETNQSFVIMTNAKIRQLRKNFAFHTNGVIDRTHTAARFVTSFMTSEENIQ
ncbi:MAG: aminotransferase class I/II-fold pyridoxal phosphate-dependent enzyme, partial [Erysipelotrichia bacterium]|nr:aminotransferase class I/II-fold pyridoxal phosphate-dependent enzyme [Erysipelotrichia bacterium]